MDVSGMNLAYNERLHTFVGHWDDAMATARQLAAMGHIGDRPPIESLEEGSRCMKCSFFSPKAVSIATLEGWINPEQFMTLEVACFHHARCERLQTRMPFDTPNWADLSQTTFDDKLRLFEGGYKRAASTSAPAKPRHCALLLLPVELRLEIYSYLLPELDAVTEIVQVNRDSMRVMSKAAAIRPTPRDRTRTSLLQSCSTIHDEALESLYHSCTFKFSSAKLLYMFLRRIGRRGRRLLRSIDILCGGREDAVAFALLACCERLSHMIIRLPRPTILFARAPLWCIEGMACLLDISGLEIVEFGACKAASYLKEGMPDAEVIRKNLQRPRGEVSSIRSINGVLDI